MNVAIWADVESRAVAAAYALGLHPAQVLIVGNRSIDKFRGRTLDLVLALPGADTSKRQVAHPSILPRGGAFVDLGAVL